MEHLKLFENYKSDEEIHEICEKYDIRNYIINKDRSVDVDEEVSLIQKNLTELPLTFNKVNGHFDCSENKLTTLKGSPKITKGGFYCYSNELTNLIGGPVEVGGWYNCSNNKELSLEGIAKIINLSLVIKGCNLTDFEGLPEDLYITEGIYFDDNPVYVNLSNFLKKYNINIKDIEDKYLDLFLEINELDAIQDGEIVDIRMDEVLYNIRLI